MRRLRFTGSTAVGRVLMARCTPTLRSPAKKAAARWHRCYGSTAKAGWGACFCTRYTVRVWRLGEVLDNGMMCMNTGLLPNGVARFGCIRQSGFGRESAKYGMDDDPDIQVLCIGVD